MQHNTTTVTFHGKTFNIHNATTITIHGKHLMYTQLQCNYNYNSRKTFNIHNTTAIHEKHLIYTIQQQLQFIKNIQFKQ